MQFHARIPKQFRLCFLSWLTAGAILTGLAGASAWAARSDQEIQHEIEAVLAERHPTDTPDWWRSLGPTAPRVILRMLGESERIYHRVRLTQALGWFDDPEAVQYLKNQARETDEDVVRNAAIRSVGHSQGAKELEFISGFLEHPDPQTRLSAAETLQKLDDSRARERLRRFMAEEKTPWLVAKLRGELPVPSGKLTPVASSEDRLSPEWEGTWSGFWLLPGVNGVEVIPVVMDLKSKGATELSGELRTAKQGKIPEKRFVLQKLGGKRDRAEGTLEPQGKGAGPAVFSQAFPFQAELLKVDGQPAIELRSQGARIVSLLTRRRAPLSDTKKDTKSNTNDGSARRSSKP